MAALPKSVLKSEPTSASDRSGKRLGMARARKLSVKSKDERGSHTPVAAAQAKAHFSELLAQVEHDRKPILISKRGKVVAHLIPAPEDKPISNFDRIFGSMRGTGKITGDIVSPDWDAWGPQWR